MTALSDDFLQQLMTHHREGGRYPQRVGGVLGRGAPLHPLPGADRALH
ncbi:hypothetical protein [Deinococcus radiophilus]